MSKGRRKKKKKGEKKKAFPPLGNFCTRQTNGPSLKFNINTDQISGAQIHSSVYSFIYSFIHTFKELFIERHYVSSAVLSTEDSMAI